MLTKMSTIVGGLACQKDLFLRTLRTHVVSLTKYPILKKSSGYAIELQDTVLFPEGGGQPSDFGTLSTADKTVNVELVLRDKLKALHITKEPLEVGSEVNIEVDWPRRIDIMQQHTGQHLLSAVLDSFNMPTLSWLMGETVNYIELEKPVDEAVVREVNTKVNQVIFDALPISVATDEDNVNTSKVPEDYDKAQGIIRVVKIGELDANPCCGTHLQSTSQVQLIALLHQTLVRGGHSRLHFVCGSRVWQYLKQEHTVLKQVGAELSAPMEGLTEKAIQVNEMLKKLSNKEQAVVKELAQRDAVGLLDMLAKQDVAFTYRIDNDPAYFQALHKELTNNAKQMDFPLDSKTVVMINGEHALGGQVKVMGPKSEVIAGELKQKIANMKGGGRGSNFQGKITQYGKGELEATLEWLRSLA